MKLFKDTICNFELWMGDMAKKKKTVFFGQHHDFDFITIYVQQYRLNLKQVDCEKC